MTTSPVERVTVLHGHTTPENAHVVEDHPYSFGRTCRKRYWVETATKGSKQGQQRMMSQTTNPDKPGEHWNKPKPSIFSMMVLIVVDGAGQVRAWHIHALDVRGVQDFRARLCGVYEQLTDAQRKQYDGTAAYYVQRSAYPYDYDTWALAHVMDHIREFGNNPDHDNGRWLMPNGAPVYLGSENSPEVYFAYARALLAG